MQFVAAFDTEYEEILLDTYNDWVSKDFQMQLQSSNVDSNIAALEHQLDELKEAKATILREVLNRSIICFSNP